MGPVYGPSFLNFGSLLLGTPVNIFLHAVDLPPIGPKDPWVYVLSLSGAKVVSWRPHLAGKGQYNAQFDNN